MDQSERKIRDIKLEKVRKALILNNMDAFILASKDDVIQYLKLNIPNQALVGVGGSQTLFECDVIDYLREADVNFLDRYQVGLIRSEVEDIFRRSLLSDYYISSVNAISEKGEIYNVDGNGNRVAALLYGPRKVILIVGENKLVKDEAAAIERVRSVAAPMNAMRLQKDTPCTQFATCFDCKSDGRICASYVTLRRQTTNNQGRITVLLVKDILGY